MVSESIKQNIRNSIDKGLSTEQIINNIRDKASDQEEFKLFLEEIDTQKKYKKYNRNKYFAILLIIVGCVHACSIPLLFSEEVSIFNTGGNGIFTLVALFIPPGGLLLIFLGADSLMKKCKIDSLKYRIGGIMWSLILIFISGFSNLLPGVIEGIVVMIFVVILTGKEN